MELFDACPADALARVRYWLTDIDDTLTDEGRMGADAYAALWRLHDAGIAVIPVTGRPAGWCDMIARLWPVAAIVGENGAFWMRYDETRRKMFQSHWQNPEERRATRAKLDALRETILTQVPGAGIASDQAFRFADLAVDFCEDVAPLPDSAVETILRLFHEAGATAKVSSIHVNGWFGEWDKLSMTRRLFQEAFDLDLEAHKDQVLFTGDSPNDQSMFGYFPLSIGVANVADFADRMETLPAYVTRGRGGSGFAEAVTRFLSLR